MKPTLDDYTTIKTYEDACEVLGVTPIPDKAIRLSYPTDGKKCLSFGCLPEHIVAMMKLETISAALWGGWIPNRKYWRFWPIFNDCLSLTDDFETEALSFPISLCQESVEKARYFGEQFRSLWLKFLRCGTEPTYD